MMNVLSSHPQNLKLQVVVRGRSRCCRVQWPPGGRRQQHAPPFKYFERSAMVVSRAVSGGGESSSSGEDDDDGGDQQEGGGGGLSREDLERLVGPDDAQFSGLDLANLIRKKYGRSYDVTLIKKVIIFGFVLYCMSFFSIHHSATT
jgi:hypothetical protein